MNGGCAKHFGAGVLEMIEPSERVVGEASLPEAAVSGDKQSCSPVLAPRQVFDPVGV